MTVPTIYNLIGGRDDLLVALFADVLAELDAGIRTAHLTDPLAVAEALVVETAAMFATDEPYYRVAFLAVEHVHRGGMRPPSATRLYRFGDALLAAGVAACAKARLLEGVVPSTLLVGAIKRSFRENLYGWAFGELTSPPFATARSPISGSF